MMKNQNQNQNQGYKNSPLNVLFARPLENPSSSSSLVFVFQ